MDQPSSQLHLDYQEMYRLRLASFKHFVKETFKEILWTAPATNGDTCAYQNWLDIKELWHKEPCNIFWAGADTLMIQPTELFSDKFMEILHTISTMTYNIIHIPCQTMYGNLEKSG
jgi:hypothetical protein